MPNMFPKINVQYTTLATMRNTALDEARRLEKDMPRHMEIANACLAAKDYNGWAAYASFAVWNANRAIELRNEEKFLATYFNRMWQPELEVSYAERAEQYLYTNGGK